MMPSRLSLRTTATLAGVASILQWAFLPVLAKLAGDIPPFQITGLAFSIAFLMVLAKWTKEKSGTLSHFRLPLPLIGLGIWGIFGFHFCYFFALQIAPPVDAFLIIQMWPLLIVLLAPSIAREPLKPYHLLGAAIAFTGVVCVVFAKGFTGFSPAYITGYTLAAIAAFTWAGYSVLSRRFASHMTSDVIGAFCGLSAALSFLCHGLFESWLPLTGFQWLIILLMGLGPVGSAFFTWNHGMKHGNIALLGILALGVPLLGTLLLISFGFGSFTSLTILATLLVVTGGAIGSGFWLRHRA